MSATKLEVLIRAIGREVFTAAEAPFAETEQQRTLTVTGGVSQQLGASTTPKIDKPPITLEIGATTTINLTSLSGLAMPPDAARTLDMTGAKVKAFILRADPENENTINVAPGGSHPYPLFGTSNDIDVGPGEAIGKTFKDVESNLPAVSSTVKNITITITGSDVLYFDLYLGT